ncbi:MAG: 3-oxoacyl-ACP reductase FabG [Thermoplasmata archaeon]
MSKVVLITGSNGGIGSATARKFGMAGYKVIFHYHVKKDNAEKISQEIGSENSLLVQADITNNSDVVKMCSLAMDRFGRIDVLVNNAGIVRDKTFQKLECQEWDEVMSTNLQGTFYVTKAVIDSMVSNKYGRIINVSSVVGERGNFGQSNYSASKSALIGFTKSLSRELAPKGILVNAIAPGFVNTEMTRDIPSEIKEKITKQIPMKRFAEPEEIAEAIYFIAESTYMSGSVIDINGGM